MSRPVTARVFIQGVPRAVKLAEPEIDGVLSQYRFGALVEGITVDGEEFAVSSKRVVSVLGPRTPVEDPFEGVIGDVFFGRRITVCEFSAWRKAEDRLRDEHRIAKEVWDEYPSGAFVVLGEDMGEVPILVLAQDTTTVLWDNPANDPEAARLYAEGARLIAAAEFAQLAHDDPSMVNKLDDARAEAAAGMEQAVIEAQLGE